MNIIENLKWRYASKVFDGDFVISEEDLNTILAAGNLAATSYGLQPFSIVVVTDKEKKQVLQASGYNQEQIGLNSALIILAARTDINEAYIAEYTSRIESIRGLEAGAVDGYKTMMVGDLTSRSAEALLLWAQKQAYIVLGTLMAAASELRIDNSPMEGFDAAAFDEILGLKEHNLHASVILALGKRAESDATAQYAKVRKNLADIVVRI